MSWVITGSQPFPAVIGEPFGGGYFAGYISHTADGNPTHALIVAPRGGVEPGATGTGYTLTTNLAWKTTNTITAGATSDFDGAVNTTAIIADDVSTGVQNHPAAQFCANLSIGGFTDWYLPSRYELDIAYFNLKPGTQSNNPTWGANIYSVPQRTLKYTSGYPAQTYVSAFKTTAAEAFSFANPVVHWSSTQVNILNDDRFAWQFGFHLGFQYSSNNTTKTEPALVRAFRRIAL